jgi:hypothetical protein
MTDTPHWTVDEDGDLIWPEPKFCLYSDEALLDGSEDSADWKFAGVPPETHAALVADVHRARLLDAALNVLARYPFGPPGARPLSDDERAVLDLAREHAPTGDTT